VRVCCLMALTMDELTRLLNAFNEINEVREVGKSTRNVQITSFQASLSFPLTAVVPSGHSYSHVTRHPTISHIAVRLTRKEPFFRPFNFTSTHTLFQPPPHLLSLLTHPPVPTAHSRLQYVHCQPPISYFHRPKLTFSSFLNLR
jgi:hypothetical protein